MKSFTERVRDVVRLIPEGETRSYKQVAELAGSPKAFRAVGTILSKNYDADVPCHRVIKSSGETGQYNRGTDRKRQILEAEAKQ